MQWLLGYFTIFIFYSRTRLCVKALPGVRTYFAPTVKQAYCAFGGKMVQWGKLGPTGAKEK
jgi:hypothetical protein